MAVAFSWAGSSPADGFPFRHAFKESNALNPPIPITSTREAGQVQSLTILVHGPSGAGKTYMARTTGDIEHTLILSAESGLLALQDVDVPVMPVGSIHDLQAAYKWLRDGDHPYRWVILDSLSEIAERILADALRPKGDKKPDGRQAYGEMQDRMVGLIRGFRDLTLNVVLIAKQERIQDDTGRLLMGPSFPGKRLAQGVAYFMDEVFALLPGVDADGNVAPRLQTHADGQYTAKDRSGRLDHFEPPNLAHVAAKIFGRPAVVTTEEAA